MKFHIVIIYKVYKNELNDVTNLLNEYNIDEIKELCD